MIFALALTLITILLSGAFSGLETGCIASADCDCAWERKEAI
jgi:hypothetical protein